MRILVASGGWQPFYRNVLAIARRLGADHEVFIASPRYMPRLARLMMPTKCAVVLFVTDPETDPRRFAEELLRYHKEYEFDALLACGDRVATVLSLHADEFGSRIPVPGISALMRIHDKGSALEIARRAGVPVPKTTIGESCQSVLDWMAANKVCFPVIVKPRIKAATGTVRVSDATELEARLQHFNSARDDYPFSIQAGPLVQEHIAGPVHDCCALYWEGEQKAILTQIRRRTTQAHGGVGAVNQTTHNTRIMDLSRTLLDSIKWHGPAQLEWIHDCNEDEYKLIEINPRFWGTLELAMEAGIDFPGQVLALMRGEDVVQPAYKVGLIHRWVMSEQLQSVVTARGERLSRLLELLDMTDLWNPNVKFTFDFRDPKPDLFRIVFFASHAGRQLLEAISPRHQIFGR